MHLRYQTVDQEQWLVEAQQLYDFIDPSWNPKLLCAQYDEYKKFQACTDRFTLVYDGSNLIASLGFCSPIATEQYPVQVYSPIGFAMAGTPMITKLSPITRADILIRSLEGLNWLQSDGFPGYQVDNDRSMAWPTNGFRLCHANLDSYVASRHSEARADMRRHLRKAEEHLQFKVITKLPSYLDELVQAHLVDVEPPEAQVITKAQKTALDLMLIKTCETNCTLVGLEVLYKQKVVALSLSYWFNNNVYDLLCLRDKSIPEVQKLGTGVTTVLKMAQLAIEQGVTGNYLLGQSDCALSDPFKGRFNDRPPLTYQSMIVLTKQGSEYYNYYTNNVIVDGELLK